ncbi:MAG: 5'/3'-nucleotidase SurE [Acidobacteria bacterium]|nr:5'/3'-nucleotidase SurE [Acidobacteriota bacterium]
MSTILVSNDDGYFAEGIAILREALRPLGRVISVAPDRDCSGISHKLSIHTPLRLREVGDDAYAVNGSPADCIHLAIHAVLDDQKPDVVISGINHGLNLGEDVAYSGTVAAAYEGFAQGIPSIAVSAGRSHGSFNFVGAAEVAVDFARKVIEGDPVFRQAVWNINVPHDPIRGVRYARLDNRSFKSSVVKRTDPRGQDYYWLGPYYPEFQRGEKTDYEAYQNGFISVTPLKVEMTHETILDRLLKTLPS